MLKKEVNNITDHLFDFAAVNPEKPALLHPVNVTYSQLCKTIELYASGFQKNGISTGTRTIVLIKPGLDLFAVAYALIRIGAVPVMIDPGMGIKAMAKALLKAEAKAFIGIPESLLLKYIFPKSFQSVKTWISTGFSIIKPSLNLSSFRKSGNQEYIGFHALPDSIAAIFFTSGSTGPAKGVIYRSSMLEAQIEYLNNHFKYNPEEIDLCTFPLIGLLVMCLGLSVVLADMDMTRPSTVKPEKLIKNINNYGCTHMFCSPMILNRLARYGKEKSITIQSLKRVMTAGAPVSKSLLQDFGKLLPADSVIHTPYGATEALPVTDICNTELLKLYGSGYTCTDGLCIGYPLEKIDIKILSINGEPIRSMDDLKIPEVNEVGEITILGPNVTQEYLADPEANLKSKIFDRKSGLFWHRTGDLGRLDENGRVWYYGRKTHRVETEGTRLFTIPCEAVFNQHPKVFRSALVGVTLKKTNKVIPLMCIEPEKGQKGSELLRDELLKLASENEITKGITMVLFHNKFPVDPRHNAKIFREKLALWAQNKLR